MRIALLTWQPKSRISILGTGYNKGVKSMTHKEKRQNSALFDRIDIALLAVVVGSIVIAWL
jgi:hypothetical protein